jgi:hypothetical protein
MTRTHTMSGGQVVVSSNLATPTKESPVLNGVSFFVEI